MNPIIFLPIIHTETVKHYAFLALTHELMMSKQIINFDKPYYRNPELGLSIVIQKEESLDYLDICLLSMGLSPLEEVGPRRVVLFASIEAKNQFREEFPDLYTVARHILGKLDWLDPKTFHLMACSPKTLELIDEVDIYAVVLSINTAQDLFQTLWQEEFDRLSREFNANLLAIDPQPDCNIVRLNFLSEAARTAYLDSLAQDIANFDKAMLAYQEAADNTDGLDMDEFMFLFSIEMLGHDLWP